MWCALGVIFAVTAVWPGASAASPPGSPWGALIERLVRDVTGTPTVNLHHDISAETGEEVIVFTLASPPPCRDRKKKG